MNDSPSGRRSDQERLHPGEMIRTERRRQGMSVRELARRVNLTPSYLSKVERGLTNPSVGSLWTISDSLGIAVADLFGGESRQSSSASISANSEGFTSVVFAPADDPTARESIKMAGVEFQRLTPHDDAAIEFIEVRHEIGAGDTEAYHLRGREYGLVLEGTLLVEVGFTKNVLTPGWSIGFDSSHLHRILNIGDEPAVAIWVVVGRNQP
jgi:transcriptional regulator with XRE-family HTH domain